MKETQDEKAKKTKMYTRANKQQLSVEALKMKAEEKRLKHNEYRRKSRAKKAAQVGKVSTPKKAAQVEKAVEPKKMPICAEFPQDLVALNNEAKRLEKNGQKGKITGEMKNAKNIINKMYAAKRNVSKPKERAAKKAALPKERAEKKIALPKERAEKKIALPKERAEKKIALPKKELDKEEYALWLIHKRIEKISILGIETVNLHKIGESLRTSGKKANITGKMREAMRLVNNLNYKQNKNFQEKKTTAMTQEVPIQIALVNEPADDEVFNVNWRPTPAPRRFKLKFNLPLPF